MLDILEELAKFNEMVFIEEGHKYINTETGEKLKSVTTIKKDYVPKFRRNYWLVYKALKAIDLKPIPDVADHVPKNKIMVQNKLYTPSQAKRHYQLDKEIIKLSTEWEDKATFGKCKGSILHNYLENRWFSRVLNIKEPCWQEIRSNKKYYKTVMELLAQAAKFYHKYKHWVIIRAEIVVYNKYTAGQVDLLVYDPLTKQIYLVDYKTDEKIERTNEYEKMKAPLSHLDSCNFNEYSIQLSMYKNIIESETNIKIDKLYIVAFQPDDYQLVEVDYLGEEVNKIWQVQ